MAVLSRPFPYSIPDPIAIFELSCWTFKSANFPRLMKAGIPVYLISCQERNSAQSAKKCRECQPRDPNSSRADDPLMAESCDKDQAYNNEHDNDTRGQVRLFHNEEAAEPQKSPTMINVRGSLISPDFAAETRRENDQTDLNKFRRLEASDHRKCDPASRTRLLKLSCDNDRQQDRHTGR